MRRAAQGVVKILVESKSTLDLKVFCESTKDLWPFFQDRIQHYFREVRGFKYDEVNAVLASGIKTRGPAGVRYASVT